MDKIDIKRKQKRYLSPTQRVNIDQESTTSQPKFITSSSLPSAEQLMSPPIGVGEGTFKDTTEYLTTSDLPDNWLELMMNEAMIGRGKTSFMRVLGLTKSGFETILTTSPEFREAYERCLIYCAEWWEDRGRDMTTGAKGNSAVWMANMVNRFGWNSERKESTSSITSSNTTIQRDLTQDELDKELERRGLTIGLLDEHNRY